MVLVIIKIALFQSISRKEEAMHLVTGSINPNQYWLNSKGMWAGYITGVAILHYSILSMPFLTTAMAWTLTHVIHNVVSVCDVCVGGL